MSDKLEKLARKMDEIDLPDLAAAMRKVAKETAENREKMLVLADVLGDPRFYGMGEKYDWMERNRKLIPEKKRKTIGEHEPLGPWWTARMNKNPDGGIFAPHGGPEEFHRSRTYRPYYHSGGEFGIPAEGFEVTDVQPAYKTYLNEGGKPVLSDEVDMAPPWNMGVLDPEGRYHFGEQGQFPGEVGSAAKGLWEQRQEKYVGDAGKVITNFNNRIEDWEGRYYDSLKKSFPVTAHAAIDGGDNSLVGTIDKRIANIEEMVSGYQDRRAIAEEAGLPHRQEELFRDILAELRGGGGGTSRDWLDKLILLYKGDFKIIRDNPLNIPYPESLDLIIEAYNAVKKGGGGGGGGRPRPTPLDLITREIFKKIEVDPAASAMGKKFFSDLDSYQGFVSSWVTEQGNPARVESVKPMFSAQMDRIENRMTEEKFKLDALKELMADVLEASSALLRLHQETRSWDDSDLVDRVDAALKRALTVVIGLYPKLDLATQTGHLNRSFNVEAGSKLEILTKVIFLCQGWNAFRKSEVPKKEPFEAVLQQGDQVGSILPPETDEDDFDDDTLAAFAPTLLRFAMVAEESGNSWLADIFEKLSR